MSDESPATPGVSLEPTGATKLGALRPGMEVLQGRFKVIELLGRGGMGDVYLAEQVSLGRKVALKTLREDLSLQPGMTERFKREARLLSTVDHPSIVRVIDFGEAGGSYVLVMEFVEGENLATEVRRGPLEPRRALAVMKDIADGLAAIHSHGIIHRDLKPDNVLLTRGPEGERARLLDFGIARLAEEQGTAAMTQAGMVLGTPEYLAPEQATGAPIDARSDVYAFGVLAYRLLAGQHPFAGPTARDFVLQHITQAPPDLKSVAPHLAGQPALVALVMSCLSKEPASRPDGGRALASALAGLNTGMTGPVAAPLPADVLAPTLASKQVSAGPAPAGTPSAELKASEAAAVLVERGKTFAGAAVKGLSQGSRRLWVAGVSGLLLLSLLIALFTGRDPVLEQAGAALDRGQPVAALELLDSSKGRGEPAQRLLRAEAYHQQKKHREEWELISNTAASGLNKLRPAGLVALMEDLVRNDRDEELRETLVKLPPRQIEVLREWSSGPVSPTQWGAIHYLDLAQVSGVDLVPGFLVALTSPDCDVCSAAARRLGELGDKRAIGPLERLKSSPRKPVLFFARSCGHDEAEEALAKLSFPKAE